MIALLSLFAVVNSQLITGQSIVMPSINVHARSNYTIGYLNRSHIQMRLLGNSTTRVPPYNPKPASASVSASASVLASASVSASALAKNVSSPSSTRTRANTEVNYQSSTRNASPIGAIVGFILSITSAIVFVVVVINMRYHRIQASRNLSSKTIIIPNPTHESYNQSIRKMSV
jgi:hypothetical protein